MSSRLRNQCVWAVWPVLLLILLIVTGCTSSVTQTSGAPGPSAVVTTPAIAAPETSHLTTGGELDIEETIFTDSIWELTLTTLELQGGTLTATVRYKNLSASAGQLGCLPQPMDELKQASLTFSNGQVIYADQTFCSTRPGDQQVVPPGGTLVSWARFRYQQAGDELFTFNWYPTKFGSLQHLSTLWTMPMHGNAKVIGYAPGQQDHVRRDYYAVDFTSDDTRVYPARAGKVVYSGWNCQTVGGQSSCYGNVVAINHGEGLYSIYAHLAGNLLKNPGGQVTTNDQIGTMSHSGCEGCGDHLHFAARRGALGLGANALFGSDTPVETPWQPRPATRATSSTRASESTAAAPAQVAPLTKVSVAANQGWQSSGIAISAGSGVSVSYVSGSWTYWLGKVPLADAAGPTPAYICANLEPVSQCIEPAPRFAKGALIGRIGSQLLEIGNRLDFTAQQSGTLELRINDGDDGLGDNAGSVTVQVQVSS